MSKIKSFYVVANSTSPFDQAEQNSITFNLKWNSAEKSYFKLWQIMLISKIKSFKILKVELKT